VTVDPAGNLLIADTGNQRVLRITPAGVILPVASTGLVAPAYAVGAPDGTVYISDSVKGAIYRVSAKGAISTVLEGLQSPRGLALDSAGDLYFTEAAGQRVRRLAMSGDLVSLGAGLWSVPRGIAVSAKGDVFVADTGLQRIFRIDAAGAAVLIAGTGSAGFSGDGGPALAAELGFPWDVALGPGGELYIADLDNNRIRMLTPVPIVVVNAASQQPGPLAPGMLVSIRGADLGSDEAVLVNGSPAPILAADSSGLVVQAPARIGELQNVQVQILRNGILRAETALPVAPAAPALFADASGQALANNEDGTINSAANPAPRASVIVLYGTGEGVAGLPISVRIAETPMEVLYAGPVAGYPGLLQINVRVPGGYVAPGPMSVVLTVGQTSSPPGVTISTN
jgi:uncharacterized protein (TIGR03437 family)